MKSTYYTLQNNVLLINFAYCQNDVICYPDLIKVSVAMDNGDVVGFESLGYIMCHTDNRALTDIAVSRESAEAALSPRLAVIGWQTAVIPTAGKNEVFCHEFKCEDESGAHCLIYVNTATGQEEKILILLESENGTLTI